MLSESEKQAIRTMSETIVRQHGEIKELGSQLSSMQDERDLWRERAGLLEREIAKLRKLVQSGRHL